MKAVVLGSTAGGGFPQWNCRLSCFTARPEQASRDVESALASVTAHATTPADQEAVVAALEFKCDVLWAMLDALDHAYGEPGQIPPGAFEPES